MDRRRINTQANSPACARKFGVLRTPGSGFLLVCWFLAACASTSAPPAAGSPNSDKLSEVMQRGTLVISTDPNYPPQSMFADGSVRAADTRCSSVEYTANQFSGFDIEVAVEIARRLGVEPCFVTPTWTQLISGNWDERWDLSVGSIALTTERLEVLYFTPPYSATPAAFFVHRDNHRFSKTVDLSGKRVGVCAGCTYEAYLQGSLKLPGQQLEYPIEQAVIVGYDIEIPALQDLALGDGVKLDAVLTGVPVGQSMMEAGLPIKQLGEPVFTEYLAAAIDRKSLQDPAAFVQRVSEIIQQMHQDGALVKISLKYYGIDLTTAASQFDLETLQQP